MQIFICKMKSKLHAFYLATFSFMHQMLGVVLIAMDLMHF